MHLALTPVASAAPVVKSPTIRVAIVDDNWMVRHGMRSWITANALDLEVVAEVASWVDLLAHPAHSGAVVVLEADLQDRVPLTVKLAVLAAAGSTPVLVSRVATAAFARQVAAAGAVGYIPNGHAEDELGEAIRAAWRGDEYVSESLIGLDDLAAEPVRPHLSDQERRVLVLYASGLKLASVARRMNLRYDTAKSYLDRVRDKYEQCGRTARTKLDLYQRTVEDGLFGSESAIDPTEPFRAAS
jgi:two-component system uhpT operon response regulator UhpA